MTRRAQRRPLPAAPAVPAAFARLARALRQRSLPGGDFDLAGLPDWLDPSAIESIALPLAGRSGPLVLDVALRDGVPAAALPRHLTLAGVDFAVRVRRAARAVAQAGAPSVHRTVDPKQVGTATALVRDQLAPDRNYLLTCGHVVAPVAGTRVDEPVDIGFADATGQDCRASGRLVEWMPPLGGQAYRTGLDAALIELLRSDAVELQRLGSLLAVGIGGRPRLDQPVSLRRRSTPLSGVLKIHWSGWVDLPGLTPGVADYFLADAVGYTSAEATIGGDSGAAVWDADERLMGMHLGAIPDAVAGDANAVLATIGPVLDWFSVQPYLRDDPATLPVQPRLPGRVAPAVPPVSERVDDDAVSVVARTLWGEARGEGRVGMAAVANVIANRVSLGWRGAADAIDVCLARKQFSCWNDGDPNLARMERVMRAPDAAYLDACDIARRMLAGDLPDRTDGATHYFVSTLRPRPRWAEGQTPSQVIGQHEFYKGIA